MPPVLPSRVGIVVRTKDRPFFLRRALEDVAAQRFDDWRVVVANDQGDRGAVDAVVADLAASLGDRVTVLDVPAPGGRCAAANAALRALDAEYVVLHDDDDWWAADFLETTVAWLDAHPTEAGVGVPTEIVYERIEGAACVETGRAPFWEGMRSVTLLEMLRVNHIVPISLLYRASLHDEVGYYDETLDAVEDWEFYLRVLAVHQIGFVSGVIRAFWSQRPAARGADGNSMFAMADIHERSDELVRDRALAAYTRQHGPGLPLYVSWLVRSGIAEALRLEREERANRSLRRRIARRLRGPER